MASPTAAPGQYPKQLVIMVDEDTHKRISEEAATHWLSKSEVARTYLTAGMQHADELAASMTADEATGKVGRLVTAEGAEL